MDILVILEDNHGSLHRISKEAIVAAQKIGGSISAIIIGENCLKIAKTLSTINIHEVITVNHHLVKSYNADGYSEILKQVIQGHNPKIIICGHTYQARDYIPRISAKLNIPFIPDAIAINNNQYTKQVLNAKLNATCSTNANCLILSVQSATFNEIEIEQGKSKLRSFDANLNPSIIRSKSEEPFQEEIGDVDLENAEVLISIGRGIEKKENIPVCFELAKAIGGEISSSRPIVDSGWIDSYRQVGSSGVTVSPKLYFSLGISGAIQHVVGMKGSKFILAINKDPEAPIFEIADYAVVGDVLEIVPKLTEALLK